MRTFEIEDSLYAFVEYLPEASLSVNAFLIVDEKPSLIDAGIQRMGKNISAEIDRIIGIENLKYIFVTHEHPDHIGGIYDLISAAYNAKVVASKYMGAHLTMLGVYGDAVMLIDDGAKINIGKREILARYIPVETNAYMVFYLLPERYLFTGDYFGQMTDAEWKPYINVCEETVRKILKFHDGLGYDQNIVREKIGILKNMSIEQIIPSHGSAIKEKVQDVIQCVLSHKPVGGKKRSILSRIFRR